MDRIDYLRSRYGVEILAAVYGMVRDGATPAEIEEVVNYYAKKGRRVMSREIGIKN